MKKMIKSVAVFVTTCVLGAASALAAVASIGNTEYNTLGAAIAATTDEAESLGYSQFLEALESANYNYDGNDVIVEITPAELDFFAHGSGVYQTSITHTDDITIKNVNFTATYPEGDTSKGTELIFTNAGALTLEKCTFAEKVGVSTQGESTKLVVRNCAFTGNTGRYALHCIHSPIVEVTGCTFDNVRGGIYLDKSKTSVTVTSNTFTNIIEDKGAVQFGSSTGNPTITLTNNTMDDSGAFIRQLNENLLDKLDNQTIAENNTLAGGLFTSDTQFFYAAQINDAKFATLQDAVNNATEGQTVMLIADAKITGVIEITKSMTLNLNGKTLTSTCSDNRPIQIKTPGVSLTIDGTDAGSTVLAPNGLVQIDANNATLTVNGGSYFGGSDQEADPTCTKAIFKQNTGTNGKITLNKVTVETGSYVFDSATGASSVDLTVNGGTYTSNKGSKSDYLFGTLSGGTLNLTGVTIKSQFAGGVYARGGVVTLKDCDFTVSGANAASAVNAANGAKVTIENGSYASTAYGVQIFNSGAAVEIGGTPTIVGTTGVLGIGSSEGVTSTATITGGTFTGDIVVTKAEGTNNITVSGGSFDAKTWDNAGYAKRYVADGYVARQNGDAYTIAVYNWFMDGEVDGVYTINTIEEFKEFAALTKGAVTELGTSAATDFKDKTVKLGVDLTFGENDVCNSCLISNFAGTFDGNGKTIKGLKFSGSDYYLCLFKNLKDGGIIRNLILDTVTLSGSINWAGGLVGLVQKGAKVTGVIVNNLTVEGAAVQYFGGIASYVYAGGEVSDCKVNNMKVNENTVSTTLKYIGGIASQNLGTVSDCEVDGLTVTTSDFDTITATASIGGVAGVTSGNIKSSVVNNVKIALYEVKQSGGLVGSVNGVVAIEDCNVNGVDFDGMFGGNETTSSRANTIYCVGGLIGLVNVDATTTVKGCEVTNVDINSAGNVKGAGGLVGAGMAGLTVEDVAVAGVKIHGENGYANDRMAGGLVGLLQNDKAIVVKGTKVSDVNFSTKDASAFTTGGLIGLFDGNPVDNVTIYKDCEIAEPTGHVTSEWFAYDTKLCYMDDSGETYVIKSAVAWTVVNGKETGFGSLQDAIDAADAGAEIFVLSDIELDATVNIIDKDIVVEGNGHTISGKGVPVTSATLSNGIVGFHVDGGNVSIQNMTLTGFDGVPTCNRGSVIQMGYTKATNLTAKNLTISQFARDAFSLYHGTFLVEDCVIDCAIADGRTALTKGFQVGTANNGTPVTGTIRKTKILNSNSTYDDWSSSGIEVYASSSIDVEDCEIAASPNGIYIDNYWAGYQGFAAGDVVVNVRNTTISDATFGIYISTRNDQTSTATVNVESGNFAGYTGYIYNSQAGQYVAPENATFNITGGTYQYAVPESACGEGFVSVKNDDGTYGVVEDKSVASVTAPDGSVAKYETLNEAIRQAFHIYGNVTVKVLADGSMKYSHLNDAVDFSDPFNISNITLDLNGHTVTVDGEVMVIYGDSLTITGEGNMVFTGSGKIRAMFTSDSYIGTKSALVIENGTFVNNTSGSVIIADAYATLTVNNGTFSGKENTPVISVASSGTVTLNGGTYPTNALKVQGSPAITKVESVTVDAPADYRWIEQDDGMQMLTKIPYVAELTDADGNVIGKYESFDAAYEAAFERSGEVEIKLLADGVHTSMSLPYNPGAPATYLTIDLNGHNIEARSMFYLAWENSSSITVVDETNEGSITFEEKTYFYIAKTNTLTIEGGQLINNGSIAMIQAKNGSFVAFNGGTYTGNVLAVGSTSTATVTKAEGVDVPAPEGYEWNEEGKLVVGYQEPVCATVTGVEGKMTLSAALAYAKANAGTVITLDESATIDLSRWPAVDMDGVAFTLDGNGAMITGLKSALFESATTGGHKVVVENLTISGATNVGAQSGHSGYVNAGALFNVVGFCDITLSNVKVVGSTIGGDGTYYAGGLIGYVTATAESVLNVVDCSVTGTTLTSTSSVGGLFGHSNGGLTTITGTEVGGNTLKGASAEKEGALIGTLTSNAGTKIEVFEATKSIGTGVLNVIGRVYTGVTYTGGEYFTDPETASDTNENTAILIEDMIVEKNGKYFVLPAVAEVGDVKYATVQEAINAATADQTVKLLKDVEESGIKVASDDKIVLDLGSFTLTGDILSAGDLTVQNGAIVSDTFTSAIESKGEGAKLTLIDAEGAPLSLTSQRHAVRIEGGTATINGGTYTAIGRKGQGEIVHAVNAGGDYETTVTITGGTFNGIKYNGNAETPDSGAAVNAQNNATVTIEDGTFAYGQNETLGASGTGTIVLKGGCYDQDPTGFCAEGYWAFQNFQEKGLFFVAEKKDPPVAEVTLIDNPTVTVDGVGEVTLESTYKFIAPDLTMDDAKASQYSAWHVDFVVSVDKDIPADSIVLAGNYGNYGWISFTNKDMPVKAGEKVRLLKTIGGGMGNENPYMSYAELCTLVKEFSCGVADIDDALDGVTFTVELQMFPIEPCTSANPSWNKEVADATPITVETTIPTSYVLGANEKGPACATVTVGDTVSEPMTLSAALEFAKNESGDVIVTLTADATLDHWKSVDMSGTKCASLTIDGDGKTIIGLTQPLVMNMPLNPLTVKNLTFKNVAVTGNTSGGMTGAGVITSGTAAAQDITLDGVTVDGGTISSENYAGAFIGYYQGHSTGDLVVNNCAVSNLTITSSTGGSIGAIAGHVDNGTATVANTAIGNVTLNSAEDGAYREDKTGVVFGTVLGAAAQVDATATAHCKVVDNDITKVVGRMNAAASLVINGGEYFTDPTVTNDGSSKDSLTEIVPVTTGETLNVTVEDRIITQEIDGVTKYVVYQEPKVAEFKDAAGTTTKDLSLTAALKLAKANPGSTVKLTANVELPYWDAPVMDGANFTLNGNSKTITGLARPLIASAATGAGNVTIKKLTISGANITGINSTHSGQNNAAAFIGVAGHFDVTLSSCKVVGSTIGGADDYYAGALVGYWCGNGTLTISEATVTDNVIAGNSSVGALVGHSNGGMEIKTSKIGGNAVTTRSDDAAKAGAVIGTITSSADNRIDVTESARGAGNAVNVVGRRYQPVHYTAGTYYSDPREASFTDGAGAAENAVTADGEIVQKGDVWIIAKAKANDEYFPTLSEAIKAANASEEAMTVTLLTDVSDGARLTINAGKTVVLDLGGHTWTSSGGMAGYGPLTNKGTLTVKNGTIVSTTRGGNIGTITNQGALTIAADATIKRRHSSANLTFSAIKNTAGAATVYGTLISDGVAVQANGGSVTIADGAKIDAQKYGIDITNKNATVNVTGGEVLGNTTAVQVTKGNLTITGGKFDVKGDDKSFLINCVDKYRADCDVQITGGEFNGFNPYDNAAEGAGTNFCPDGYVGIYNEANGTFMVGKATNWIQVADTSWYDAEATEFTLDTPEKLAGVAKLVNGGTTFNGVTITLGRNMDLAKYVWPGIGVYAKNEAGNAAFQGIFEGANKTVKGMTFADNIGASYAAGDPNNYRGLFNQIANGAVVENLIVSGNGFGKNPPSGEYGGAMIVGHAYRATIRNCVAEGSISGSHNTAGVVVRIDGSQVLACTNNAAVSGSYNKLGGIIAIDQATQNSSAESMVDGCVNNGVITSSYAEATPEAGGIGGIIGWAQYYDSITVKNCTNNGEINGGVTKGQIFGASMAVTSIGGVNKGLATTMAVNNTAINGLNYATVEDGVATYVKNAELAAGNTYLVTAPNPKPVITLAAGQSITFDLSLATIDETGITAATELEKTTDGNRVTYTAKAYVVTITWPDGTTTHEVADGETFTLAAKELAGMTFVGWSGDVVLVAETLSVTVEKSFAVTANYLPSELYTEVEDTIEENYKNTNELVNVNDIVNLSLQYPTIKVGKDENGSQFADVGIKLMKATTLKDETTGKPNWEPVKEGEPISANWAEDGETMIIRLRAEEKAQFFRFVPVNGLTPPVVEP